MIFFSYLKCQNKHPLNRSITKGRCYRCRGINIKKPWNLEVLKNYNVNSKVHLVLQYGLSVHPNYKTLNGDWRGSSRDSYVVRAYNWMGNWCIKGLTFQQTTHFTNIPTELKVWSEEKLEQYVMIFDTCSYQMTILNQSR